MKLKDFFLNLVFPKKCLSCGVEGAWVCSDCFSKIEKIKTSACPFCNRLTDNFRFCQKCRRKTYLSGIISAAKYQKPLDKIIFSFKYDFVRDVSAFLSSLLINQLKGVLPHKAPIIIPVPLHKKRKAWRGFNQAEILAKSIGQEFNLPVVENQLIRVKNTTPQIKLSKHERWENIKDAFLWQGRDLNREVVLLVDDVCTTSSTLNECAKVLKKAGARQVWGIVLAKE